jgi:hypothetical protein
MVAEKKHLRAKSEVSQEKCEIVKMTNTLDGIKEQYGLVFGGE